MTGRLVLQTVGAKTKIEHFRSDQKSAFESSKGVLIMAGSIYPPPGHEPPPRNSLPYDQGVLRETNGLYSVWYMFFFVWQKITFLGASSRFMRHQPVWLFRGPGPLQVYTPPMEGPMILRPITGPKGTCLPPWKLRSEYRRFDGWFRWFISRCCKVYQSHGPFFRVVLLTMAAFGEVNDLNQRLGELSQDVQDGSWKG